MADSIGSVKPATAVRLEGVGDWALSNSPCLTMFKSIPLKASQMRRLARLVLGIQGRRLHCPLVLDFSTTLCKVNNAWKWCPVASPGVGSVDACCCIVCNHQHVCTRPHHGLLQNVVCGGLEIVAQKLECWLCCLVTLYQHNSKHSTHNAIGTMSASHVIITSVPAVNMSDQRVLCW